jgi:hypothetical protein
VELRDFGIAVAAAGALLWASSGTQRERPLLTGPLPEVVRAQEVNAVSHPGDAEAMRALAQTYLDAAQPGLVLALFDAASPAIRAEARTQHIYARALLDQGRNADALAVEANVVTACTPLSEGPSRSPGCDAALLASALRRASILEELVTRGVEDTRAHPEASFVAYQNATREARMATP